MSFPQTRLKGFSLAELLVSLLILGEIATFTIPKILSTQRSSQYRAGAVDLISTISGIYLNDYMVNGGESWLDTDPLVLDV